MKFKCNTYSVFKFNSQKKTASDLCIFKLRLIVSESFVNKFAILNTLVKYRLRIAFVA